ILAENLSTDLNPRLFGGLGFNGSEPRPGAGVPSGIRRRARGFLVGPRYRAVRASGGLSGLEPALALGVGHRLALAIQAGPLGGLAGVSWHRRRHRDGWADRSPQPRTVPAFAGRRPQPDGPEPARLWLERLWKPLSVHQPRRVELGPRR